MFACRPRPARRPSSFVTSGVALTSALAMGLLAGRAQAYCQEVTETPPANYNPTVQGCWAGSAPTAPTLFWRNWCMGYSLQENASRQITLAQARVAAAQAFATWEAAQCTNTVSPTIGDTGSGPPSFFVSELTPVSCDETPSQEHNNPIIFRDDSWPYDTQNALGYTTLTVDLDTGEIFGATIEINTSPGHTIVPTSPPPAGSYDLPSILTHEAGHFLGLAHATTQQAVMYALYSPGSTSLQPDDVLGICNVYYPIGTRNTQSGPQAAESCNPAPRLGFLDGCGSIDSGIVYNGFSDSNQVVSTSPTVDGGGGDTILADSGGVAAASDAGPGPLTENLWGCSLLGRGGPQGRSGWALGALGLLCLAIRRLRSARR
jgi:hypothetical protein